MNTVTMLKWDACSGVHSTVNTLFFSERLPPQVDVTRHEFALEWMSDFDTYHAALERDTSYAATLSRSLSLVSACERGVECAAVCSARCKEAH